MSTIIQSVLASGAHAAHSVVAGLASAKQIEPGQQLADVITDAVKVKSSSDAEAAFSFSQLLSQATGKIVIVGVPGAFTPPCSNHVPGYIEKENDFYVKGVSKIYVVAVNDAFTLNAWKEKLTDSKQTNIEFIADDQGALSSALGLLFDATKLLGGPRCKRSVVVVEDGTVTHVAVEAEAPSITVTSANIILAQLA